jgi:acyl-CoA synthetase (AMP-forming)/AMP-acid ligase II
MSVDVSSLTHRHAVDRWNRVSVGDMLERMTWSSPDQEAIVGWRGAFSDPRHERLTYRQADELANQVANGLLARGLQRGDRVALFCENSVEAYLTKIAIAKAGLVAVPLNPGLAQDVVRHVLTTTQPRFAVVDAELWPRAREPFADCGVQPDVTIPIGGGAVAGSVTFAQFAAGCLTTEPDVEIHADDIWQILFTSGTTALPKGAMVSHQCSTLAAYSFALTLTRGIRLECDLRLATFLPIIYHVADQVFTFPAFLSGGTLVIGRSPAAVPMAEAISRERITALWGGSPAMVIALTEVLRSDRLAYDPRCLKVIVYGWAALPPGTRATLQQLCGEDLVVVEIFGQTEAITCHRFWPDKWPQTYLATAPEQNYVGVPNPLLSSVLMDPDGNSLEGRPGVPGEAVYRSPTVTAGYYLDEAATAEAFRYGWFHSGDSCMYDDQGLRIMVDRYKDIVKTGGENVSSLRVESVLTQHPAVARAAVIGLTHDRWGEAVTAVVVRKDGVQTSEAELLAFCRERLAGFETPKGVIFVEALPETVGGKVLKYKLRQQFSGVQAPADPDPVATD